MLAEYKTYNYNLKVERFYNEVFLYFEIIQATERNINKKISLGEYDEYCPGYETEKEGNVTIYYPSGTNETISVDMSHPNQYKISVKDFDIWYFYKDKN